jgi:hypothetical protein
MLLISPRAFDAYRVERDALRDAYYQASSGWSREFIRATYRDNGRRLWRIELTHKSAKMDLWCDWEAIQSLRADRYDVRIIEKDPDQQRDRIRDRKKVREVHLEDWSLV